MGSTATGQGARVVADARVRDGSVPRPAGRLGGIDVSTDIVRLPGRAWDAHYDADTSERCMTALERGGLVVLPELAFVLAPGETRFLDVRWLSGRRKNISVDGARVGGSSAQGRNRDELRDMIARFAPNARTPVAELLPRSTARVREARTSFRPAPVEGRAQSPRHDDRRLHVDAFPSRPNRGERILRVFSNVNAQGQDRVWRVGEPFEVMASRFLPSIRRMRP